MTDPRTRNDDPFRPPEDYGDPWRRHRTPILLTCLGIAVLVFVVLARML